jgi:hypothetical protein
MKSIMIAVLVAATLSGVATAVSGAELPREESATPKVDDAAAPRVRESVELSYVEAQAVGDAPSSAQAAPAQDTEGKKRKSTGDKVLTGAAVILGIGAVAVGGLLAAIFIL